MDSNQSLAKIGVFVLLAVNVGAYCYFWPRYRDAVNVKANVAGQEKGETQLLPPKSPAEPRPLLPEPEPVPHGTGRVEIVVGGKKQLLPDPEAISLAISNPPALPERIVTAELRVVSEPPAEAAVLKLAEHIDKDKLPELPTLTARESAKSGEPVRIEFAPVIPTLPRDLEPGIAVASPLTPKMPAGIWQYQIEKTGNRTHLTARLSDAAGERVVVEFRVHCDRAESNPQTGTVQAIGNVDFSGAGWKGTCRTLTLPVQEPRLVFEGEVRISQDVLGSSQDGSLRGERFVWELPGPPAASLSGVTLPLSR
jgi:hypothetical protein